jgi:hypothetical protein
VSSANEQSIKSLLFMPFGQKFGSHPKLKILNGIRGQKSDSFDQACKIGLQTDRLGLTFTVLIAAKVKLFFRIIK